MSAVRSILDDELVRVRLVLALMLMALALLAFAMWRIQVASGERYQEDLIRQSVRRVRLPGTRGRIFDSRGICLADNRPNYCIALYIEELRQPGGLSRTVDRVELIISRLAEVLRLPQQVSREEIQIHIQKRLPLPLLAWQNVDGEVLARFSERAAAVPGVDIHVQALRSYPAGASAAHVLGYVGRAEILQEEDDPYHYYLPEMEGRSGIEARFDEALRGQAGGRLVRVDVAGFRHEDLAERAPRAGSDVQLAIDLRAQRLAEKALGEQAGAVVVLDPRNGDVLAMASAPAFDPNMFVPAIPVDLWKRVQEDPRDPLVNRAVAGAYAPGSTFKPVVALAALENRLATGDTTFECTGYLDLGKTRFRCWTKGRHGLLHMREAIEQSCNVYFYQLGLQCGHEYISHMAGALGLGQPSGISLPYEVPGLVPDDAWSRRTQGHGWRAGDTCNLSIGQGALLVTPLQMAMITATLANGGHLHRPRLVKGVRAPGQERFQEVPPEILNELNWSADSLRLVQGGVRDVVMSERGTGKLARVEGVSMAGKTGTAEYGPKEEGRKRGWMIAYAPADAPRYAVAMIVEEAITGGVTVAPRMKQLMSALLGRTREGGQG